MLATTLQAVSGAGYPGVPSVDILGNAVPFIGGEEEKLSVETCKLLGEVGEGRVEPAAVTVSAHCNRVPTVDGHLVCASVELEARPSPGEARAAMADFRGQPQRLALPTAPRRPVQVVQGADRPQPRRDVMAGRGMAVTVGRVRECSVLGLGFAALGHNTIRGAAGASVLNAELLVAGGWVTGRGQTPHGADDGEAPGSRGAGRCPRSARKQLACTLKPPRGLLSASLWWDRDGWDAWWRSSPRNTASLWSSGWTGRTIGVEPG